MAKARAPEKPKRGKKLAVAADGVIYARYSSHNQKDRSIEQQVDDAKKLATSLNIRIREIYADRALTGRNDNRPSFQKMMRDATKGRFKYVVSWKSNRIGRNMLEALVNEARLQDLGVRVIYVEEDFDDTAAGRFAARSMMNVNQFYSEAMAEDIRRGLRDNAKQGLVACSLPYGYKSGKGQVIEIDEPRAEVVRQIYTQVACGVPYVDIANELNARGIKTRLGGEWNKGSFHRIVSNERYRGIYIYSDIRIEGGMPRIVSDELFYKVQEVIHTKGNPQNGRHRIYGDYLLTGKLFCGHCKAPMVGMSGTGKSGKLHHYYVCQTKRTGGDCRKTNVRREVIEETVAKAVKTYALQDDMIEWIADSTVAYNKEHRPDSKLKLLRSQLADVQRSIKNIMGAIEKGIYTETTRDRLQELEQQRADLTVKITLTEGEIVDTPREDIIAGLRLFRDGNVKDKKYQAKLFDTFLIAVYLYDDGKLKIVFSFSGKNSTITVPLEKIADAEEFLDGQGFALAPQISTNEKNQPEMAGSFRCIAYYLLGYKRKCRAFIRARDPLF